MGRKCCVFGCRTGYRKQPTDQKITVYRFPKNEEKRRRWVASLPNQLNLKDITNNMTVCALHWPKDVPMERNTGRYHVPSVPPSIFQNVPQSCIPRTSCRSGRRPTKKSYSAPRATTKSTQEARTHDVDEMPEFKERDTLKADTFHDCFSARLNKFGLLTSDLSTRYILLSHERKGPIYKYSVYFDVVRDSNYVTLKFELYQHLNRIHHPFIKDINCWSELDEVMRFVTTEEECSDVEMVREGQLRTKNSAKHRPGFTEVCQNLDKKVELPSLVCGDQSGTVTTDVKVEKPFHVLRKLLTQHRQTSLELPDSASGGESVSTLSGTSDTSQSLAPGKPRGTYYCPQCSIVLPDRSKLRRHFINTHISGNSTVKKKYKCEFCDAQFSQSFQLKMHTSKHTGVKPFHCDVCGVGFTQKKNMNIHMRKHTGEKPCACEDCGARFVNRRQLKVHRISHTGEKPFKCDVCGLGFNQAFGLKVHKRKHTGKEPYKCGKGYKQYVCKNGYKPYVCEICGLTFSSIYYVQYHKKRHNGEKPHQCDVCGVAFALKTSLISHKRKHTGETPYSCDDCGLRFSEIKILQNHQRKHTGEKPHLCDICGTKFAFKGSLRDHKRLHTGEKPFKCGLCYKHFSNHKKLYSHRKVHAGENLHTSAGSA